MLDAHGEMMTREEVLQRVRNLDSDVVGIGALSTRYNYVKGVISYIKQYHDVPVMIGGPLATYNWDAVLSPNPPKDTDGRREDSGRGWVRELQGRWPGVLG